MTNKNLAYSELTNLESGMQFIYQGDKVFTVNDELAKKFKPGDSFLFVYGQPIIITKKALESTKKEVELAYQGVNELSKVSDVQIDEFYDVFQSNLSNNNIWEKIQKINEKDIERAISNKRSTTRLIADDKCRHQMINGLREFQEQQTLRIEAIQTVLHDGWSVDVIKSPLGVVGFVFEGRPNVIADATGVLKSGNTGVFRVGQDALETSKAIVNYALYPALDSANISRNVIRMIQEPDRESAWALFCNKKLNLAVARGSGQAVQLLGEIAQQHGIPVSLHGTGGAWIFASNSTKPTRLKDAIIGSLDRKVCNTLNTICLLKSDVDNILPIVLSALEDAGQRLNQSYKVHVEINSVTYFNSSDFHKKTNVVRADGIKEELQFEKLNTEDLSTEWGWEKTPEISIVVVDSIDSAIELFNLYSPQFVASLITESQIELTSFYNKINAPFVGNGMTRWVDGQYALNSPELGLSNWENGRFLARSAILSGNSVFTTRVKMTQVISNLSR